MLVSRLRQKIIETAPCCVVYDRCAQRYARRCQQFLPRDAMHPRYMLWACVCLCLSQVGVLLKRLNESGWFLACELPSTHALYTVFKGNLVISKNKGTSLRNFVLNSGFRKFRHGILIVETCYQLSSRKVDAQSVINWAVVGQLSR